MTEKFSLDALFGTPRKQSNRNNSGASEEAKVKQENSPPVSASMSEAESSQVTSSGVSDDMQPPVDSCFYVDAGTMVSRFPIERYRAKKGVVDRIAILTQKKLVLKIHYTPQTHYFYCFGGSCCRQLGLPYVRYIHPILKYETDPKGRIIGTKIDIQFLQLGAQKETSLVSLNESVPYDTVDFLVTCTDEQMQKFDLQNCGPAVWRKDKEFEQAVLTQLKQRESMIPRVVAKILNESSYAQLMAGAPFPASGINGEEDEASPESSFSLKDFLVTD